MSVINSSLVRSFQWNSLMSIVKTMQSRNKRIYIHTVYSVFSFVYCARLFYQFFIILYKYTFLLDFVIK